MCALQSKTFTFSAGATILASEHNTNYDTLYNLVNGNIDNANIKDNAGIVDSKLDTISTAGKVSPTAISAIYPIGIVITLGVSTNPNILFGFGTWTAIAGKVIVGIDGTQTEFDALNETGGAKTHTLDVTEIPAHTHTYDKGSGTTTSGSPEANDNGRGYVSTASGSTGGGGAHNNLQPYIVKYVWERTA